jgi:hypothetical protein
MQIIYKRKRKALIERAKGVVNEDQKNTGRYPQSRLLPVDSNRRQSSGGIRQGVRQKTSDLCSGCGD